MLAILLAPYPGECANDGYILLFYLIYILCWIWFGFIVHMNMITKIQKWFNYFKRISFLLIAMTFFYVFLYIHKHIAIYYEPGIFHGCFILIAILITCMIFVYFYKRKQKLQ